MNFPLSGYSMWLLIGLFVLLCFFEIAARVSLGVPRSEQLPLIRVKPDRHLGFRPLAGDQHYGYDELVVLNSLGLRGSEAGPKDVGEYRILALGGTQVYGLGIADQDLVSNVFETQLKKNHSDRSYQVINCGVRAYTLKQQVQFLKDTGLTLKPDHVVIFLDNYTLESIDIQKYYQRISARDWYMLDLDAKPFGIVLGKWYLTQIARKSALVSWLHSIFKVWKQRNSFIAKVLRGEHDYHVEKQLSDVKTQIDALVVQAQQHHFQLSLVLFPIPSQVSDVEADLSYQSTIHDIAKNQGITFFSLLSPLRSLYQRTGILPVAPFDGHYDANAHKAIGRFLADKMHRHMSDLVTVS